jgi:cell volume regulation protein A
MIGGNGFLAAFIAGLVFHVQDHMRHVEHKYADFIDVFGKGAVFFALGMLVDVQALLDYAVIGILSAIAFMFIFRPLAVLVSIGPFLLFQGKDKTKSVSLQDMLFMMWVRETGAIPAVLLVVAAGMSIPGTEALVPVGMWVIILTLIVQPPLTPWFARKLGLVD